MTNTEMHVNLDCINPYDFCLLYFLVDKNITQQIWACPGNSASGWYETHYSGTKDALLEMLDKYWDGNCKDLMYASTDLNVRQHEKLGATQ